MRTPEVIAAIPNYNMADSLKELVPTLLEQDYAKVVVVDDASTDHSADVIADFGSDIVSVLGRENAGAGPNRNRVLSVIDSDVLIHFVDADMTFETEDAPEVIQDIFSGHPLGFMGGLIKNLDGQQMHFNYGPRMSLHTDLGAQVQNILGGTMAEKNPAHAEILRKRLAKFLEAWPNPLQEPVERQVFWSAEANLVIPSAVFQKLGGFDPHLRNHEIIDLAIRAKQLGLERRFNPALSGTHKAIQVRPTGRNQEMAKAELQIIRKHGLLNWIFPDGKFKPEL